MRDGGACGTGKWFPGVIYQRALEIEFREKGIGFQCQFEMPIFYKENKTGKRRVDFFIEDKIMVEIKAVKELENAHLAQAKNYLEVYKLEVGLLLNFGAVSLQFKRLINTKHNNQLFQ